MIILIFYDFVEIIKKQTEQYFIYTDNNLMDVQSAKREYLLDDK
jgi:hypothetical protein